MKQDNITFILDDGQRISGKIGELSQHQIISLANQFRRQKNPTEADLLMAYQHRKFWASSPPPLFPRAA